MLDKIKKFFKKFENWQIASSIILLMLVVFGLVLYFTTQIKYAEYIDGIKKNEIRVVVNQEARKMHHVIERDHYIDFGEEILKNWSFEWCEKSGCTRIIDLQNKIVVEKSEGWTDRLRYSVNHALLFELEDTYPEFIVQDHNAWLGSHQFCYGSANCEDAREPEDNL